VPRRIPAFTLAFSMPVTCDVSHSAWTAATTCSTNGAEKVFASSMILLWQIVSCLAQRLGFVWLFFGGNDRP
jgi:hypothetical protein